MHAQYRRIVSSRLLRAGATVEERRSSERFELKLGLEYRIPSKRAPLIGFGETCDISSRSLRFHPDKTLSTNSVIELSIDWPAQADDTPPLRLTVVGTILSSTARGVVVLIKRYGVCPAGADLTSFNPRRRPKLQ